MLMYNKLKNFIFGVVFLDFKIIPINLFSNKKTAPKFIHKGAVFINYFIYAR
jgi:hypothetical protein